jgi:cell division transport system permease protein
MVNFRYVEFLIEEAFIGVRRNGLMAIASISTIALSLAILCAFFLLIMGVHQFVQGELQKFEIAVFMKPAVDAKVTQATAQKIRKMPAVSSVTVVTAEQAWPEFKKKHAYIDTAGLMNPLPDRLRVTVNDPKAITKLASDIRSLGNLDEVQDGQSDLKNAVVIADLVKWFGFAACVALLLATIFIISNAIRLTVFVRRREIKIMQMVGATNWFIRIPLVIEGVIFGGVGAAIAFVLIGAGKTYLASVVATAIPTMQSVTAGVDDGQLLIAVMFSGVLIGALGSFISIRRFLRT